MTTLTGTGQVIAAKAGCRGGSRTALTGFPRIEYGAGWVKAGMTEIRLFRLFTRTSKLVVLFDLSKG